MSEISIKLETGQIDAFIEVLLGKPEYGIMDVRVDRQNVEILDGAAKTLVVRSATATRGKLINALRNLGFHLVEDGK